MRYGATISGETLEVDINRRTSNVVEAQIGDRKYVLEARAVQPGLYWLNWENRSIEVVVTEKNGGYLVMLDGRQVMVELGDLRTALRHAHQGQQGTAQVRAPMPGKVIRVLVKDGDSVQANQGILGHGGHENAERDQVAEERNGKEDRSDCRICRELGRFAG